MAQHHNRTQSAHTRRRWSEPVIAMSQVVAGNQSSVPGLTSRGDAYVWRLVGTALSFAAFGLAAALLNVTVFPALRLLPRDRCRRWSRIVLQRGMRVFIALMSGLGVLTYRFLGAERLGSPGQLIVANHPTLIDAVFLIAFTPQPVCVAKSAMFRNPLTRSLVAAAGYISNEGSADMVLGAANALAAGQCLIMFPEGTRTRVGEPLTFQRGAANIGVRAARTVTPVYIECEPITLTKGEPWYRIPPRRPHFSFRVGEDFPFAACKAQPSIPRASRAFNADLLAHFESELQRPPGYTEADSSGTNPGSVG
jgi:1-acyl-sn-glycerol-3-phosphate acyltransferase